MFVLLINKDGEPGICKETGMGANYVDIGVEIAELCGYHYNDEVWEDWSSDECFQLKNGSKLWVIETE